ncbi:MAG: redoxin domain-containing protein [bacterium]|nr:redoxin domain-containing protein [bacterium]
MPKTTLSVGDDAPNFKVTDVEGKKISLEDYSSKYLLIAFLRYAGCPWCNLAVHRLTMEQNILRDSKCELIVFIQSSTDNIEENIIKRHKVTPKFPIIADQEMKIYKKYFVKLSVAKTLKYAIRNVPIWVQAVYKEGYNQSNIDGSMFIVPATFLISRGTQKIVSIDYNADLYDHQSLTKIYDSIAHHQIYGFTK